MSRVPAMLGRLERVGRWAEDALLVLILTAMIGLATAQIVLRNVFDVGFIWGDEMLRMLVLWLAVAGAVAASRSDKHIRIDLLNRYLPDRAAIAVQVVAHLFTAALSGLMAWHSLAFVRTSWEFGDVLLGSVPAWIPQAVLPAGFALIAWRYALFTLGEAGSLLRRGGAA
ncbi:MAG: TRAP transporter small permease [Xanthomonadales bacterium]